MLQVSFNQPEKIYAIGDVVKCQWRLKLDSKKSYNSIYVRYLGRVEVSWTEDTSSGSTSSSTTRSDKQELFRVYVPLSEERRESFKLEPGEYTYETAFQLPVNIPESFEGSHGKVIYEVKIHFKSSGLFDQKLREKFIVQRRVDIKPVSLIQTPQVYQGVKEFGIFNKEMLTFIVRLSPESFNLLKVISGSVLIENNTNGEVIRVKFELKEKIFYCAEKHKNRTKRIVKKFHLDNSTRTNSSSKNLVEKYQKREYDFQIPLDVITDKIFIFNGCEIIHSEYVLDVEVQMSGMKSSASVKIPIKAVPSDIEYRRAPTR